jgi:hypothetical protein
VTELLCSVTRRQRNYTGMSMLEARAGIKVNPDEFVEVLDNIDKALAINSVRGAEQDITLGLNCSLKDDIIAR